MVFLKSISFVFFKDFRPLAMQQQQRSTQWNRILDVSEEFGQDYGYSKGNYQPKHLQPPQIGRFKSKGGEVGQPNREMLPPGQGIYPSFISYLNLPIIFYFL